MKTGMRWALAALVTASAFAVAADELSTSEQKAMKVMDDFMTAFNARDPEAWAATLNYPHVRIASSTVRVSQSEDEIAKAMDFDRFSKTFNWHHSTWDSREIVQSSDTKVHIAVVFSRYDKDGNKTATFNSLYIVTNLDGHWGIQARSSFAP